MPNVLEYSKVFQTELDKQVVQESTTGWMELNEGLVQYNGGNEVKIPKMSMDGLGNYDRSSGFADGAVTLEWQTHTLTQDRGRTFSLDAMDVDETNFVATAGTVMGEFQRTKVVPEIDAYRYSKIATLAINADRSRELTVSDAKVVDELLADLNKLEDDIGVQEVVITMNPILAGKLAANGKEFMSKVELQKLDMSIEVQAFNDNPIVKASSRLLKSEIEILDGVTSGQEAGGFKASDTAKDINWIISTKDAPIAVSKTDKVRTFTPDQNQAADAYKVDYRKYHDLWIPENKLRSVFVNIKPGA